MKKINLNIICPKRNEIHYQCLREVIIYFDFYLNKMGFEVTISKNHFFADSINIVFFAFKLPFKFDIPKNTIIFNSEDLNKTTSWVFEEGREKYYFDLLEKFPVIDWSYHNLDKINNQNKVYLPLLFCETLKTNFLRKNKQYFLYIGCITDHRRNLLKQLSEKIDLRIITPGTGSDYGFYRDKLMMDACAVINLHKSEKVEYFESVRCFYPLINKVPVISEEVNFNKKDNHYQNSIFFIKSKSFISEFINLINDKVEFENKSKIKLSNFEKKDGYKSFNNSIYKILDNI
jgi:hypothetical protein